MKTKSEFESGAGSSRPRFSVSLPETLFMPALLLVFLVSCSQPPPATFQPWGPSAQMKTPPVEAKPAPAPTPAAAPIPSAITTNAAPLTAGSTVTITNRALGLIDTNAIAAMRAARIAEQVAEAQQPQPTPFPSANPAQTNAAAAPRPTTEETIPPNMLKLNATPLEQVLQIYSELVNRTVLRPATLPAPPITLMGQTELTRSEAIQALDAVLALNGIAMINVGDKFVKAVPIAQANTEAAAIHTSNEVANLPDLGPYVTHIVQLQYVKPSSMQQTLQAFAKNPAALLPVDESQILVIRDYTENVKRMLELIKKIDVPVQSEYDSEVIPIKYAKAGAIADALNSLSSGGGAVTTVSAAASRSG